MQGCEPHETGIVSGIHAETSALTKVLQKVLKELSVEGLKVNEGVRLEARKQAKVLEQD